MTLQITGNTGTQTLTFTSGTTASAISYAVNSISDSTGVTAKLTKAGTLASGLTFQSTGYGSKNFVSVPLRKGTFATVDAAGNGKQRVVGQDAVATINGSLTTGDGLKLHANTSSLDLSLTLDKTVGLGKTSFAITGGGALFQLGPTVSSGQQVSIGISSVAASQLGNANTGFLNDIVTGGGSTLVNGKSATPAQIIDLAITQVADLRGRLGAFEKNTLNTNMNSLNVALENVTSSQSDIARREFCGRDVQPDSGADPDPGGNECSLDGQFDAAECLEAAPVNKSLIEQSLARLEPLPNTRRGLFSFDAAPLGCGPISRRRGGRAGADALPAPTADNAM